jgi:hypothetical protein
LKVNKINEMKRFDKMNLDQLNLLEENFSDLCSNII